MNLTTGPLAPLAAYPQFIIWQLRYAKGDWKKFPTDYRTLQVLPKNAGIESIWLPAETARALVELLGPPYGLGFVFTAADPFFFIDLDKCYDTAARQWMPKALKMIELFPGAAVEVSQSGTGLHIIGSGVCPPHRCKCAEFGFELYTEGRFAALTDIYSTGSAATDFSAVLPTVVERYFKPGPGDATAAPAEWTTAPVVGYSSQENDDELIVKARASGGASAAFGGRATFNDLWVANEAVLGRVFPDSFHSPQRAYDPSMADAALVQHLLFWTGGNCDRVHRLMLRSALAREKWGREDYIRRTVLRGLGFQKQFYSVRPPAPTGASALPAPAAAAPASASVGYQYLSPERQVEYFKGCVYVQDVDKVFTPEGNFLKQSQVKNTYGGYVFQLDDIGKKTTRDAWEAFTQSQANRLPKVMTSCFKPRLPPGQIISEEGRSKVNTFVPIPVDMHEGDVSPFLDLLRRILPVENDRKILLSYMAACLQHIGVKFQWAPVLQGTFGNGKSFMSSCVAYGVGTRYSHFPKASEIAEKFNEWMFYKLFIGVEDIKVHADKQDLLETLKPMITSDRYPMRAMHASEIMMDSTANWIINTNHQDAIASLTKDRRFCPLFTRQQEKEDLTRDGLTPEYFHRLYTWAREQGGYAFISYYLRAYKIEDAYNPATLCQNAPATSSTQDAAEANRGRIEGEILEAIGEGVLGFCGGWISSVALEGLLTRSRDSRLVPNNKRRDLLKSLGYVYHPALAANGGRVNNPIPTDGNKKPRLFIKVGHPSAAIQAPADVVRAYVEAQNGSLVGSNVREFPAMA